MIIVEYVISVLQMIKGVIMLVYGLYYPNCRISIGAELL